MNIKYFLWLFLTRLYETANNLVILSIVKAPARKYGGFAVTGNNLSSQAASSPVLSTRESLTAVFGMGTGGASQPSSPDLLNGLFRFLLRQAAAPSHNP